MPLKHFEIHDYPDNYFPYGAINKVIDYANELEARLKALEHPVERLSEETAPKCNCMMVNDKRVCPQHDVVITNDHKC